MMNPVGDRLKLYIETTVVSLLTARPSSNVISMARQLQTQQWWEEILPNYRPLISYFVRDEATNGDARASKKRLEALEGFEYLENNDEVEYLAGRYYEALQIPEKAELDAYHLAIATYYKMDYIVSWNFKHIAGERVRRVLYDLNNSLKLPTPVICTPENMLEARP